MRSDVSVVGDASGIVNALPIALPNGDTHSVDGSPSVAAQPPIAGTPVRRWLAVVPVQPSRAAMVASVLRRSSRAVIVGVNVRAVASVNERTRCVSGSLRQ